MQVAEGVAAYEAAVGGEGDVAFENAGAHACTSHGRLDGLFWELKRPAAAVANGEVGDREWTVLASLKLVLEGCLRHVIDDVVRPWSQRDVVAGLWCWSLGRTVARPLRKSCSNVGDQCRKGQVKECSTHVGRFLQT